MTKRELQARQTKQKLLDAADEIVKQEGASYLSVSNITKRCGVSYGTFYHYFNSIDEMSLYLNRSLFSYLRAEYEKLEEASALKKLHSILTLWLTTADMVTLFYNRQSINTLTTKLKAGENIESDTQIDLALELIQELLQNTVNSGELTEDTPVVYLATLVVFQMCGCGMYYVKTGGEFDFLDWGRQFIDFFFNTAIKPYIAAQ